MFDNSGPGWERQPDQQSVSTFRDALGLAMALSDDYAFLNAAFLLDRNGNIGAVTLAEGIGGSISPLITRLCDRRRGGPPGSPVMAASSMAGLLITVRPFEVDIVRESDLALFRRASWALAGVGIELIDWIETDGDLFRSYAYVTCPALAWPDDPSEERLDKASG